MRIAPTTRHFLLGMVLFCSVLCADGVGPEVELFHLSEELLQGPGYHALPRVWRYHPDEGVDLADTRVEDENWVAMATTLRRGKLPRDWTGAGWFRCWLVVEEEVAGRALALRVRQTGASEIYLDGDLVARVGRLEKPYQPLWGESFVVPEAGRHVLAVRYQNRDPGAFIRAGSFGGFHLAIALQDEAIRSDVSRVKWLSRNTWLFTGVFCSFAALHLLLFVFEPSSRGNLIFSLLCFSAAALVWLLLFKSLVTDPRFLLFSEPAMNLFGIALAGVVLAFVDHTFDNASRARWYVMLALGLPLAMWSLWDAGAALPWVFVVMLVGFLESFRVGFLAVLRGARGARTVGLGLLVLSVGFAVGLLANLGVLPWIRAYTVLTPFYSVMVAIFCMSIALARDNAETHRQLVEKKLLEVAYAQKTKELEEARELQLSMLPENLPEHPELEIAAWMGTATEVGGDYYDFEMGSDGSLTLAVGDATGHGMQAGTLVTATKGIFGIVSGRKDLDSVLGESNLAVRRMNLRRLAMALMLARFDKKRLHLAAAGMPPVLLHRQSSGTVEAVEIAGAPLGSFSRFPFRETSVIIEPGDTLLFMSDGFPERVRRDGEQLGYERASSLFARHAREPVAAVLDHLVADLDEWAEEHPPDDDTTLVVVRVRDAMDPNP